MPSVIPMNLPKFNSIHKYYNEIDSSANKLKQRANSFRYKKPKVKHIITEAEAIDICDQRTLNQLRWIKE